MPLLDTNALLWFVSGNKKLGTNASRLIRNSSAIHYSAISLLELEIKKALGKLAIPTEIDKLLALQGLIEINFKGSHAGVISEFPALKNHDPFDRAILASAAAEGLILLTSDEKLLSLGLPYVIDAQE